MASMLDGQTKTVTWRLMVDAAKRGATEVGYSLKRRPGRGLSNIFDISRDGATEVASIRTTRDRWFAFPPLESGAHWKTLDEVDTVIVSAVDSKEEPENVEVYLFPADEVRERFDAAYKARAEDGQANKDNFGMWVNLDPDPRGIAASVGSGIAKKHPPIARYAIADLLRMREETAEAATEGNTVAGARQGEQSTIAEVMAWARQRVAELAGVRVEAVKLDLKVEY